LCLPSVSLLYSVVNMVEQQFSRRGVTLSRRNLYSCFSEHKQLRRSSCSVFSSSVLGLCQSQPIDKHLRKNS
jgi:hypothetical protein